MTVIHDRGRANLWTGFNTPAQIADLVTSLSKNVSSSQAYSVIPVNAWSMVRVHGRFVRPYCSFICPLLNVSAVVECVVS